MISGPPLSRQAKRRNLRNWRQDVQNAARATWPEGDLPFIGDVQITIVNFYSGTSADVDNIPKPILDALKELVYIDDEQVTDIICRKRSLQSELRIENPTIVEALISGNEFLYILAEAAPDQEELML